MPHKAQQRKRILPLVPVCNPRSQGTAVSSFGRPSHSHPPASYSGSAVGSFLVASGGLVLAEAPL